MWYLARRMMKMFELFYVTVSIIVGFVIGYFIGYSKGMKNKPIIPEEKSE